MTTPPSPFHALLLPLAGEWHGTDRTWFEPNVLANESPIQGVMQPLLDGRFLQYDYQATMQGEVHYGRMTMGYHLLRAQCEMAWIDSFHMHTGILFSVGSATPDGFSVLGHYPAGEGPDWGWRTELKIIDANHIIITAYNILPTGEEAKAVESDLVRQS